VTFSIQGIGGAVAIVVWWILGIFHPDWKTTPEVIAASVVLWQMVVGIIGIVLVRIFGADAIYLQDISRPGVNHVRRREREAKDREGGGVAIAVLLGVAAAAVVSWLLSGMR
jgi:hypothetical protein